MIDEGILTDALRDAANSFEVSKEATDRILSEARASAPESGSLHAPAFLRRRGRSRTILMAAALIVVVGGITLPLLRTEAKTSVTASAVHAGSPRFGPGLVVTGAQGTKSVNGGGSPSFSSASGNQSVVTTGTALGASATSLSPKIESNGSVDLTVSNGQVESAFAKLNQLAMGDGGFVVSTQANVGTQGSGKFSYGTVVLQVPQKAFETLVAQVQRVGRTTSIVTSSTDVTGQYVDLRARITALEGSRQQYLTIMTRARSIGDILAVQDRLNTLQSQIEQLQGQMNVLDNATTYGTLTVMISEVGHRPKVAGPSSGLGKAWHDGIGGFVAGFEWLIRIAGPALFAGLCLGALLALGRLAWRATRRRRI